MWTRRAGKQAVCMLLCMVWYVKHLTGMSSTRQLLPTCKASEAASALQHLPPEVCAASIANQALFVLDPCRAGGCSCSGRSAGSTAAWLAATPQCICRTAAVLCWLAWPMRLPPPRPSCTAPSCVRTPCSCCMACCAGALMDAYSQRILWFCYSCIQTIAVAANSRPSLPISAIILAVLWPG